MKPEIHDLPNQYRIAPCGINCSLCMAFQRSWNRCTGCMSPSSQKLNHCSNCKIRNCEELKKINGRYCFECDKFPCKRLEQLDKRYQTKYGLSVIKNLQSIKEDGVEKFIEEENIKWKCANCGSLLCMHRDVCHVCQNSKGNRWLLDKIGTKKTPVTVFFYYKTLAMTLALFTLWKIFMTINPFAQGIDVVLN